jgi:hypothetical protein
MQVKLIAPAGYWNLTDEQKKEICNGCGGRNSVLTKFLPQGTFKECCNIHDYMYFIGRTEEDKKLADRVFYLNLNRVVKHKKGFQKFVKKIIAKTYFTAVKKYGDYYFWKGKVPKGLNEREVEVQ